jgi:hypothetical protein
MNEVIAAGKFNGSVEKRNEKRNEVSPERGKKKARK